MNEEEEEVEVHLRQYTRPISEPDLLSIIPKLHSIAKQYAPKNRSLQDDLVQAACLALVDGRRKWENAFTCSRSAMKDYMRQERRGGCCDYDVTVDGTPEEALWADGPELVTPLQVDEMMRFEGLNLDERDMEIARLYFVDGLLQEQIAERVGCVQATVGTRLNYVREQVKTYWLRD